MFCGLLSSCVADMSLRRADNPMILQLQEEEAARHAKDDSARATLKKHMGERVNLLLSTTSSGELAAGGRATVVTSDVRRSTPPSLLFLRASDRLIIIICLGIYRRECAGPPVVVDSIALRQISFVTSGTAILRTGYGRE
jgi:hypothetical protein